MSQENTNIRQPEASDAVDGFHPLRIGGVSYLNTLPLISGLEKLRGVRLTLAPPCELAGLLMRDEVDVALVSAIDAQRAEVPLSLLPCGMIGCDGPTLTVRVFSRVPFDQITAVHADAESHTSIALFRTLMHARDAATVQVHTIDATSLGFWQSDDIEAILLIGDKVMSDRPDAARFPYEVDLGQAWHDATGLPFVYAAWMCKESHAEREEISRAITVLDRQRRHNATRLASIVSGAAESRGWDPDTALHYVRDLLRYNFDDRAQKGLKMFYEMAASSGAISTQREARIVGTVPSG